MEYPRFGENCAARSYGVWPASDQIDRKSRVLSDVNKLLAGYHCDHATKVTKEPDLTVPKRDNAPVEKYHGARAASFRYGRGKSDWCGQIRLAPLVSL